MGKEVIKIRPNKGAMWYMQMQSDYFDSDFNNTFSGMVSTAHGFLGFIKSYITANWDKKIRSTEVKIKTAVLIATLDDDRLETIEDVTKISQQFMALGKLDSFQVSKDKKFLTFGIKKMLEWLDIFSKNEVKRELRLENLYVRAEQLNIPNSISDSSADEWVEYMYTKHHTLAETKKKNGFVILKKWEDFGECEKDVDYSKKTSKSKAKKEIHKGDDSKINHIASLDANKKNNTNGQDDWEVLEQDSSLLSVRHKSTKQQLAITDTDIIADSSLTLQEKITKHTLIQGNADRYADVPF